MKGYIWPAIGLAGMLAATSPAAAGEHDNFVNFAIAGISAFTFTENPQPNGHSIEGSQQYSGATGGVSQAGEGHIDVVAGRKGSKGVATWFQTHVGVGQTLACDSTATFPNELNFAAQGTFAMTLTDGSTVICPNVIIAQGHFGTTNNWWMGGPGMMGTHISVTGAAIQVCAVTGSLLPATLVIFTPQTPCVNNFNISFVPTP